jgi:hypothetical protein
VLSQENPEFAAEEENNNKQELTEFFKIISLRIIFIIKNGSIYS